MESLSRSGGSIEEYLARSTDTMQPPAVVIRQHSFNSPEARDLIRRLDADLAAFYPDWDQLSHPNHGQNPQPGTFPPASTIDRNDPTTSRSDESQQTGFFFFVAFDKDLPIGCAALRLLSPLNSLPTFVPPPLPTGLTPNVTYGEVKRMYIATPYRGRGISKQILAHVERYARDELKLEMVLLETGLRQKAAVNLYRSSGYTERPTYGEYIGMEVEAGGDSMCMEKRLI